MGQVVRAEDATRDVADASAVMEMVSPEEFIYLQQKCSELYGLRVQTAKSYQHHVKSIMARQSFTFTEGLSDATKTYQLIHVIGHYHFMTSALRRGVSRYDYIFESFQNASLMVYDDPIERLNALSIDDLAAPYDIPADVRANRIVFEAGANKYAELILTQLGMMNLWPIIKIYEPADIQYLLDITAIGRPAIMLSDYDYITKYVCGRPPIEDVPDIERVFDPESFRVGDIDWPYLDSLKLEFHFF